MKLKLLGLIVLSSLTAHVHAQNTHSSSYAKQFAEDSANSSYKNNNAFGKGYTNKYNGSKSSSTSRCRTTAAERKAGRSCTYEK